MEKSIHRRAVDGIGKTIMNLTGADIREIVPVQPYTSEEGTG